MKMGLEVFLASKKYQKELKDMRIGIVCHPASVNDLLKHSLDLVSKKYNVTCAFGPQHGVRGDKQDNMIESDDYTDPVLKIPIYSLYGKVRKPTAEMMSKFDVLLYDLQDVGCRIYTYVATLLYMMEACQQEGKKLIVLDRPNPAGRPVEGFSLIPGSESFVGVAPIPMRHGLTVGELALYFKEHFELNLDLEIVPMQGYKPLKGTGFGWPIDRPWVNPSPNAASLNMARAFCGTVLLEGTTLSEGRGTTKALEVVGAPDIDFAKVLKFMKQKAPQWLRGVVLRECFFEPTFHKHQRHLCKGFQFHTDVASYNHLQFKPFRITALMLKIIRELYPNYVIFREFPYEYITNMLPFDALNGGPSLRQWIDDPTKEVKDLDKALLADEKAWVRKRKKFLLY